MDMSLSNLTWCPPWYVSWSILGMLVLPLVMLPILRSRSLAVSEVPLLIGLTPLLHGCVLAYLGARSVFLGMAIAGIDSPVALSAGFADAHGIVSFAASISGIILSVAIVVVAVRTHRSAAATPRLARRAAAAIATAGAVLLSGVFGITFAAMYSAGKMRIGLYSASSVGAWLAGAVVLTTIVAAFVDGRASRNVESSTSDSTLRSLAAALAIVVATGATSWFARAWFMRIATTGG
jgi:hypothetical protein